MKQTALAFALLATLPACPLFDADVEITEVCITHDDIRVGAAAGPGAIQKRIVVEDLAAVHEITDHAEGLTFRRAQAIATSGITDFRFVEAARIALSPGRGDSTSPPLTLDACDGDCVSRADTLSLDGDADHDVLAYLRGDAITIDVDLAGDLPRVDWTMSVVVCFAGEAGYGVAL